jgi:hypothetical protein
MLTVEDVWPTTERVTVSLGSEGYPGLRIHAAFAPKQHPIARRHNWTAFFDAQPD